MEPVCYSESSRHEARIKNNGRPDPLRRAGPLYYGFGELEDSFLSTLDWIDEPLVVNPARMQDAAAVAANARSCSKGAGKGSK